MSNEFLIAISFSSLFFTCTLISILIYFVYKVLDLKTQINQYLNTIANDQNQVLPQAIVVKSWWKWQEAFVNHYMKRAMVKQIHSKYLIDFEQPLVWYRLVDLKQTLNDYQYWYNIDKFPQLSAIVLTSFQNQVRLYPTKNYKELIDFEFSQVKSHQIYVLVHFLPLAFFKPAIAMWNDYLNKIQNQQDPLNFRKVDQNATQKPMTNV